MYTAIMVWNQTQPEKKFFLGNIISLNLFKIFYITLYGMQGTLNSRNKLK